MAEEETVQASVIQLVIEAIDELTEPIEAAEKSLRGLIPDVREVGASCIECYAVKEALESVVGPAEEMQTALADLAVATGKNIDQLEEFKQAAEDASTAYGVGAEDVVSAQTILVRTLGNTSDALAASNIVVQYGLVTHKTAAAPSRSAPASALVAKNPGPVAALSAARPLAGMQLSPRSSVRR